MCENANNIVSKREDWLFTCIRWENNFDVINRMKKSYSLVTMIENCLTILVTGRKNTKNIVFLS